MLPSCTSTTPSSREAPVAPMPYGGSRGGSITPSSRGGSVPPSSHGGSTVPTSHRGSAIPPSHRTSAAPNSHGGSIPNSRSTSTSMVSSLRNRTSDAPSSQHDSSGVHSLPVDPGSPASHNFGLPSFKYSDAESQIPNDHLW